MIRYRHPPAGDTNQSRPSLELRTHLIRHSSCIVIGLTAVVFNPGVTPAHGTTTVQSRQQLPAISVLSCLHIVKRFSGRVTKITDLLDSPVTRDAMATTKRMQSLREVSAEGHRIAYHVLPCL